MTVIHPLHGIDTNLLIYALYKGESANDDLSIRAKSLTRHLWDIKHEIAISVISLSEYLVKIDPEHHVSTTREIESYFRIAPFNARAAQIAAELFPHAKRLNSGPNKRERTVMSADVKIIASLVAAGVYDIHSNDERFLKIANLIARGHALLDSYSLFDDQLDDDAGT